MQLTLLGCLFLLFSLNVGLLNVCYFDMFNLHVHTFCIAESCYCLFSIAYKSYFTESFCYYFYIARKLFLNHFHIAYGLTLQTTVFVDFTLLFFPYIWLACCRRTFLCDLHTIHQANSPNEKYRVEYQGCNEGQCISRKMF